MEQQTPTPQQDDEIDLQDLIYTLLDRKWSIVFFISLFTFFAFIYAFGTTPTYTADSLIQVESKASAVPGLEAFGLDEGESASVSTEIELILSRRNLNKALEKLNLDIVTEPARISLLGNISKKFYSPVEIKKLPLILEEVDNYLSPYAWGNESITVSRLTVPPHLLNKSLIMISNVSDSFKLYFGKTLLLQGKVGESVNSVDGSISIFVRELNALPSTKFLVKKLSNFEALKKLKEKISISEKGKKTGIISLTITGGNKKKIVDILDHIAKTYLQQNESRSSEEASLALDFLKTQIKPIKEKAEIADANIKNYRTKNKTADISIETMSVLTFSTAIDTELQTLALKKEEMGQLFTVNHPVIQSINSQIEKLKTRKSNTVKEIVGLPETQQQLLKLQRDYTVANTIYENLLNNIQEYEIAKASSLGNVFIIDYAIPHDKAIKPKKAMILALGALLGGMLGILIAFIRKALHQTITNPDKLEGATGIPVYATIPLTKEVNLTRGYGKSKRQKSLLASEKPNDPAIESLRSLRTSLHFALLESKSNIVMITGPSSGIGKSFTSSNFAAVISSGEQKVLLIDADMRKGYLHNLMNKAVSPGLSELIADKAEVEDVIHTIDIGNSNTLDILTRGQTPPNPSELLMHSRFEKLLTQLSTQYDLILIDTPPVHAVTDPTIIGKHAGVTFMVIYHDKHNINEIEHAVSRLSQTGIETKGFIFNGYVASANRGSHGYYSYYGDYK